ncbi:hypothetical protein GCM10007094_32470 [Pseudovibrio japonicus]|uniref:Uncharacterized protein n=1 Tax=Pseudovibrio japonicus TaxID=366534 RepID=A0ABQ3EHZ5_9HYPH|nr:hypothetical protein [Pseudovibrio japonicus]GHB40594.1 hypothetical protein GCM10007094_32470 [Pseudovibrio japonicus]
MFRVLTILLLVFVTAPHAKSMPAALAAQQTAQALQTMEVHAEHKTEAADQTMQWSCCDEDGEVSEAAVSCIGVMSLTSEPAPLMPSHGMMHVNFFAQDALLAAQQAAIDRPPIQWAA